MAIVALEHISRPCDGDRGAGISSQPKAEGSEADSGASGGGHARERRGRRSIDAGCFERQLTMSLHADAGRSCRKGLRCQAASATAQGPSPTSWIEATLYSARRHGRNGGIPDSVIVIDEPRTIDASTPEVARIPLGTMRSIKPQNQIWCATHSAELIDEAGRERTFFLRMDEDRAQADCISAVDEESEVRALRDLFGYAGYVGISKKVVFIEGQSSGADRRTFSNVIPGLSREVKLIPVGSSENLYRINRAILALLESDFARCEFFLIRDRDYLSDAAIEKHKSLIPGRLFILSRYHIENYLIDEEVISQVLLDTYSIRMSVDEVRGELFGFALQNSAGFLRDMVSFRLGELFQSEDCSIGRHSERHSLLNSNMEVDENALGPLSDALMRRIDNVHSNLIERTCEEKRSSILQESVELVRNSLTSGQDQWKSTFPGRYLLQRFSGKHQLGRWPALQNVIIDRLSKGDVQVDRELLDIFSAIGDQGTRQRGIPAIGEVGDGGQLAARASSQRSQ